jgi:hypothetical protein
MNARRLRAVPDSVPAPASVDQIPALFLQCRDLGHQFRPFDVAIRRRQREIIRSLRCHLCGTLRHQALTLDGYITGNRYEYQDGYVLNGAGRLTISDRAAIRVLSSEQMKAEGLK